MAREYESTAPWEPGQGLPLGSSRRAPAAVVTMQPVASPLKQDTSWDSGGLHTRALAVRRPRRGARLAARPVWAARGGPISVAPASRRGGCPGYGSGLNAPTMSGLDMSWRHGTRTPAIPAESSSPVITGSAALAFRKHQCDNTP